MSKGSEEVGWAYRSGESPAASQAAPPQGDATTARPVRAPRRLPTMARMMEWISTPFQLMLVIGLAPLSAGVRRQPNVPVE